MITTQIIDLVIDFLKKGGMIVKKIYFIFGEILFFGSLLWLGFLGLLNEMYPLIVKIIMTTWNPGFYHFDTLILNLDFQMTISIILMLIGIIIMIFSAVKKEKIR